MFQIIFYPEGKLHETDEYLEWKSRRVQSIINKYSGRNTIDKNYWNNVVFHIFNDINDNFSNLKEFSETIGLEINFF